MMRKSRFNFPQLPVHDEDCDHEKSGFYRGGCIGCIHQLIKDGKEGLSQEIGDMTKRPDMQTRQHYVNKMAFLIRLEQNFP